jgi:AraC-like DNA-binding protein
MSKRHTESELRKIRRKTYEVVEHLRSSGSQLFQLDQEGRLKGVETLTNITGPGWMLGMIEVRQGRARFVSGPDKVDAPARRFGLFMPAFSLVQIEAHQIHYRSRAFCSVIPAPATLPGEPVVFRPRRWRIPSSLEEAFRFVEESGDFVSVNRAPAPSPFSERIKVAIDKTFMTGQTLSAMAKTFRIAPATISRYFKRDYGISPVQYRQQVRIMDSIARLLRGEEIKDVFQEVGFADMSRFYKQFRALVCVPPGRYRPKRSKNAKT